MDRKDYNKFCTCVEKCHLCVLKFIVQCNFMFFLLLIRNGHLEIVQFLVNGNHCQANAVDNDGKTALHYAAS